MKNEQLHHCVTAELAVDPRLDVSRVGVKVAHGIVTLIGHVNTYTDKVAVADAARRVKGVRGVVVDVGLRPARLGEVPDEELAKRATAVLAWRSDLPSDAIKVTVEDGCLALNGTVDWQFQRLGVESDLRRLTGVVGIRNDIAIRCLSCSTGVRHAIREAMRRRADVQASRIHIEVDETGRVTLEGKVENWDARSAAEEAAWLVAGVKAVENRVTVR